MRNPGRRSPIRGAVAAAVGALGVALGDAADPRIPWRPEAELAAAGGGFGQSVALDGDTAVVGIPRADGGGTDSGAAVVFVRSGGSWTEQARLVASDAAAGDEFGTSVAVSGDTVVVGSPGDDGVRGAAYVFVRAVGTWTQEAKLVSPAPADWDQFGISVALDGDTALAGTPWDDEAAADGGAVFVFARADGAWSPQGKLMAADAAPDDYLGGSVALRGDTAVAGAPYDDDAGADGGSAYVFTRSGTTWSQQAKLAPTPAAAAEEFGWSVAVDGDTALVGADGGYFEDPTLPGSACVFTRSGDAWTQQARLTDTGGAVGDHFGAAVALEGDLAVIGAPGDDEAGSNSGSAFLFRRSGGTWTRDSRLGAADPEASGEFGAALAMDGGTLMAGERLGGSSVHVFVEAGPILEFEGRRARFTSGFPVRRSLDLVGGTTLSVQVKVREGSLDGSTLRVLDPAGVPMDLADVLKARTRLLRVRRLSIPATGRFYVETGAGAGLPEEAVVTVKVKPPARFAGKGTVAAGSPLRATLATLPGAKARIVVGAAVGSGAVPTVLGVKDAAGNDLLVPGDLAVLSHGAVLAMAAPAPGGDLTVEFGLREGSEGAITWSARIREPRGYAFTLP